MKSSLRLLCVLCVSAERDSVYISTTAVDAENAEEAQRVSKKV